MRARGGSATAAASIQGLHIFYTSGELSPGAVESSPPSTPPGTLGGLIFLLNVHLVVVTVAVHPVAYVLSWPTCIQHRVLPSWPPCIQHRLGNISNVCLCAKKRLTAS